MSKKTNKNNEELTSRRDFLKKAAKAVLPAIAISLLTVQPIISKTVSFTVAYIKRNVSRNVLTQVWNTVDSMPETQIKELDYLDPFEVYEEIIINKINNFKPDELNGI